MGSSSWTQLRRKELVAYAGQERPYETSSLVHHEYNIGALLLIEHYYHDHAANTYCWYIIFATLFIMLLYTTLCRQDSDRGDSLCFAPFRIHA